jgi:hypothetical protein
LLFEGRHRIGTRAGAIAVSNDIRASGLSRMRRVDAIEKPRGIARRAARWIAVERRLIRLYASTYLRVWYDIERARTARERAMLPIELRALIDAPDALQATAGRLESALDGLHRGRPFGRA